MGVATFLIGLLPTYASVGIWAPVMLLFLRIFQGIGIGGEWVIVLMAVEHSPAGRRGFYGSWPQIGVPAGLLLSSGMVYLLSYLPEADFYSWGWRIAFLISAVLVAVGLYIRLKIMETPAFTLSSKFPTSSSTCRFSSCGEHTERTPCSAWAPATLKV